MGKPVIGIYPITCFKTEIIGIWPTKEEYSIIQILQILPNTTLHQDSTLGNLINRFFNMANAMIYNPPLHNKSVNDQDHSSTKRGVHDNHQRIASLEREVANLSHLVEGLWNLLQSQAKLDDDNLRAAVETVIKGKKHQKEKKRGCKTCTRFVSAQYKKCIYCGGDLVGEFDDSPFG